MRSSKSATQTSPSSPASLSPWRIWWMAARPFTLPAAIVPVLVGSAAAASAGFFLPVALVAALISSLFIQIGTNLANDLFDFKKGADTGERLGPTRVTQAGLLTEQQVARGMWVSYALAVMAGLYLIWLGGLPILLIGVLGIISGILYTAGPWPLGYNGLGDLFSFLFFGVVAVGGTYYVHAGYVDGVVFILSLPVALLVTAILAVNNLRDVDTDRVAGKRTLAVRLGEGFARRQYVLFVAGAYVIAAICGLTGMTHVAAWLPWLTLPAGVSLIRTVAGGARGVALNGVLKRTCMLHLYFGLLWAGGLWW